MSAKHYSNAASTATRTATQLRKMAEYCQDAEAKGILLAAARVSAQIAKQRKDLATKAKREEAEYEAFIRKTKPEALAKIKADWPTTTTLQRAAIIAVRESSDSLHYSLDRITRPMWPGQFKTAQQRFDAELDYAREEIAGYIAYLSWTHKRPLVDVICNRAKLLETYYTNTDVKRFAEQVDAAIAKDTLMEATA